MNGLLDMLDTPEALLARDLGKGLLSVAPVSGEIMSAQDAVDEYKKGNYWMSLLAGLGAIPIAGTALRLGRKGVGAVSDLAKMCPDQMGVINAYHGTPHTIDKFSMDKIGTGEGAQAYGHGLYFAENPATAESYKNALSLSKDGKVFTASGEEVNLPRWAIQQVDDKGIDTVIDEWSGRLSQMKEELKSSSQPWLLQGNINNFENQIQQLNKIKKAGEYKTQMPGNLYQVDIDVEPEDLLDWDAPLKEQSKKLQENLRKTLDNTYIRGIPISSRLAKSDVDINEMTGRKILDLISHGGDTGVFAKKSDPAFISGALKGQGIPGIKYYDGMSREAGKGTRNYVIFDDSLIGTPKPYK